MSQNILLDPEILIWVLLPLVGIMVFLGILRHYVTLLLNSKPVVKMDAVCNSNVANYAQLLLRNGSQISSRGYRERVKRYRTGPLTKKVEMNAMDMMSDPSMMGDLMKNNIMMVVPNMGMMMLVSYFFSGFIVAKFPFQLPARFRGMIQRGVDIDDLECSYVTSLSMYFLILFGLQGIIELIVGENTQFDASLMAMPQLGTGAPNQPVDYTKIYKQLSDELELHEKHHGYRFPLRIAMHLQVYMEGGKRVYTLKKVGPDGNPTLSAHPARFSPDDKYSRHRVTIKRRFKILASEKRPKPL